VKRRIFNGLAGMSLLLSALIVVLWRLSYGPTGPHWFGGSLIWSTGGHLIYERPWSGYAGGFITPDWRHLGFLFYAQDFLEVIVPYWFATVITLAMGWWFRRLARRRPGNSP